MQEEEEAEFTYPELPQDQVVLEAEGQEGMLHPELLEPQILAAAAAAQEWEHLLVGLAGLAL